MGNTKNPHNDAIINLNPRINSGVKKDFERKLLQAKLDGYDIHKASLFRALAVKFNSDPNGVLEYLGVEKSNT